MISIFAVGFTLYVGFILYGIKYEYETFIKRMALMNSFDEIIENINAINDDIKSKTMSEKEMLLEKREIWEQILLKKETIEGKVGEYSDHRENWQIKLTI